MDITTLGVGVDTTDVARARDELGRFIKASENAERAAKGVGDGAKQGAGGMKDFEDSMTRASIKGVLGATAIEDAVRLTIDALKQLYSLMMQIGDYQDFADMTGASAINIAKLQTAADVAGVSMEGMAGYMNQLTRVLKSTDEEGDKAAKALARIGINFEDFQKLDPAERMATLGQAMAGYADGVEKTEIAQALFGRGAGAVVKVLKELEEEQAFTTKLNAAMIISVDDLADSNARLNSQFRQQIQLQTASVIPAWIAFKAALVDTLTSVNELDKAGADLKDTFTLSDFSVKVGTALAGAITAFQALARLVEMIIALFAALAQSAISLAQMDFKGIGDAADQLRAKFKDIFGRDDAITAYERQLDAMLKKKADAAAAAAGGENAAGAAEQARIAQAATDKQYADAKKQAEEFDKILGANAAKASGYNAAFVEQMKIINAESKVRNYTEEQYKAAVDALIAQQPFYEEGVKKTEKALDDAKKKREEFAKLENALAAKQTGYNENYREQVALIVAMSASEGQRKRLLDELMRQQPIYQDQLKRQADAMKEVIDAEQKMIDAAQSDRTAVLKKSEDAATAAEEELANFGKLKSAIAETTLARMEELAFIHRADPIMREFYEQQIKDQKRLIAAVKGTEVLEAHKKSAEDAKKEYDKVWEQVGQSFADQLMEGGRSASDYIKNLFRTMVLRPMVQAAFTGGGGGGAGGGGGGYMDTASSLSSGYSAISGAGATGLGMWGTAGAGWAGATGAGAGVVGTGIGTTAAGAGAAFEGSMAAAGYAASSGGTAAGVAGGLASGTGAGAGAAGTTALGAIPVVGWIALAAIAAYMLYKKFGKHGGPKIEGSAGFGAESAIGNMGNEMDTNAQRAVLDLNSQYKRMAQALGSSRTDMQFGVGLSTDPRGDAPSMVQIRSEISESVNRNVGRSQEDLMKALAEASATVMVESLRNSGMDSQMLAYFDKITVGMTDEAKLAAFEQVAAVGAYWKQLKSMSAVVKNFGNISLDAAVSLAELSGGVQNLGSNIASYTQNYLTPKEQEAIKYQQIAAELNAAGSGYQGFTEAILRGYSREKFREIVEGLNLESEGDRMRYVALMKVAGAFAELKPVIDKTTEALKKQEETLDVLRDAYERQKDVLTTTRDAMHDATQSFEDFNKSLRLDPTLSNLPPGHKQWELQAQYEGARNRAIEGGYKADDVQRMQDAARALLQGSREFYGSGAGYDAIFKKIKDEMEAAAAVTRAKESVAQSQLDQLEKQVGVLVNMDKTLISVEQALREYLKAREDFYALGNPHAEGLSRVPFNNYPALLHRDEMVLPAQDSAFIRGLPDFSGELRALRTEVAQLRKENRQDAGNTIGATFTAAQQAAQVQSEATIRAARQRSYQSRSRPVLA